MESEFCITCRTMVVPEIVSRKETFPVRGEDIEVEAQVAVCPGCAEDLSVEELDEITLQKAFDEYRARHDLLSPQAVRDIRNRYGLSQRAFSLLLGWGEITVHRYESGSIQDAAHDAQLRMAADARNMVLLLKANGNRLSARQRSQLETALDGVGSGTDRGESCMWPFISQTAPDEFSGFRTFDPDKLSEMIVYFSQMPRMFRTKLNKLLFYADFLNFKQSSVSMSGAPYLAFERGPVPQHYDWITEALEQQGAIRALEWTYEGKSGEIFTPARPADTSLFSSQELQVLTFVRERFAKTTSEQLSNQSHAESAYSETALRQMISYRFATDLSISLPE